MKFFDSYALFEIMNGNPAYERLKDEIIITSALNIGELYYGILKTGDKSGEDWLAQLKPDLIEIDIETMKNAMKFRYANRQKKLSMVDCVGYSLAQKLRMPFLTGDKEFEGLPNVEFVK